jgi:hypothetical protein
MPYRRLSRLRGNDGIVAPHAKLKATQAAMSDMVSLILLYALTGASAGTDAGTRAGKRPACTT